MLIQTRIIQGITASNMGIVVIDIITKISLRLIIHCSTIWLSQKGSSQTFDDYRWMSGMQRRARDGREIISANYITDSKYGASTGGKINSPTFLEYPECCVLALLF